MTHVGRTYIILTREVLVGHDMAQCIVELFPGAEVLQFHSVAALHDALRGVGAVDTAFLEAGSIGRENDRTIEAVASRGARIVLLGGEDSPDTASERRWRGLPIPFDTLMLHQRLI